MSAPPVPRAIVIAHRGASALLPEHTLAAYRRAVLDGADFIEPDLVVTRDGHLVARHENALSETTNVAEVLRFASRRTTKVIDGITVHDWFAEDFTLAELKELRARERIPGVRPGNTAYTDETIPTLREIIGLVRDMEAQGRRVGIYPEIKHPTFFAREGRHLDGRPIARSLGRLLVEVLVDEGFTDAQRVYVQSFELAPLLDLAREVMPRAGVAFPLIQLFGDLTPQPAGAADDGDAAFRRPWDVVAHARGEAPLAKVYGDLADALALGPDTTWADLATAPALAAMARHYAAGIGVWTTSLLPRTVTHPQAPVRTTLTGAVHPVLARARAAGLAVHAYTLRPEAPFLTRYPDGRVRSPAGEVVQLLGLGVSGVFADHPAIARRGRAVYESLAGGGTGEAAAAPTPP